jgi:hypothetical protein
VEEWGWTAYYVCGCEMHSGAYEAAVVEYVALRWLDGCERVGWGLTGVSEVLLWDFQLYRK